MQQNQIERRDEQGNITQRAEYTMLVERAVTSGDARVPLGPLVAVYVNAGAWRNSTAEEKTILKTDWKRQLENLEAGEIESSIVDDYDLLTIEGLRERAQGKGVSLRGITLKEDIINALRAADITARHAPPTQPSQMAAEAADGSES